MTNTIIKNPQIVVTDNITRQLKKDFGVTNATILNALKFRSFSPQANEIRSEAIRLMDITTIINKDLLKRMS